MVKVNSIEIHNYRSCINTTLDVRDDLTTLIGVNGVGKSNILHSLLLLKKIYRNHFFDDEAFPESLKRMVLAFSFTIDNVPYILLADVYLENAEDNQDNIYSVELQFAKKNDDNPEMFSIDTDLFDYVRRTRDLNKSFDNLEIQNEYLKSEEGQIAFRIVNFLLGITYYSATQFADPGRCPVSVQLEETKRLESKPVDVHRKFILDLYSSYRNDKTSFAKFLSTVNHEGIGLIDEISFFEHSMTTGVPHVNPDNKMSSVNKNRNIIIPSVTVDGVELSFNQLSEGTFKTLALIFYILNDKSELLLIEEPEVCVHYGLLSSVIELIKLQSKEKQIIISTHSDFVLDKLKPENIILVKKDTQTGTKATPLSKAMSADDYMALKEYLHSSGNLGEYWKEGGFDNE